MRLMRRKRNWLKSFSNNERGNYEGENTGKIVSVDFNSDSVQRMWTSATVSVGMCWRCVSSRLHGNVRSGRIEMSIEMFEYAGTRRIVYEDGATFVPVCPRCGRYVRADETIGIDGFGGLKDQPNATCSRCGRVKMLFEGFM